MVSDCRCPKLRLARSYVLLFVQSFVSQPNRHFLSLAAQVMYMEGMYIVEVLYYVRVQYLHNGAVGESRFALCNLLDMSLNKHLTDPEVQNDILYLFSLFCVRKYIATPEDANGSSSRPLQVQETTVASPFGRHHRTSGVLSKACRTGKLRHSDIVRLRCIQMIQCELLIGSSTQSKLRIHEYACNHTKVV